MADNDTDSYQELEDHNRLMEKLTEVIKAAEELFGKYDPAVINTHNNSSTAHADIRNSVSTVQLSVTNLKSTVDSTIDSVKSDYTDKIAKVESTINKLIGDDGGVAFANRAKYNANNYELTDDILTDLTFNDTSNVFAITRLDGDKSSFSLKKVTTTTDGLMSTTDKNNLDTAVSNISAIQVNISNIESKQVAITDSEIESIGNDTLWPHGRCWNDSSWTPWQNRNEYGVGKTGADTSSSTDRTQTGGSSI